MITGELKNKVDKIWETFWTGGLTNPLEVIEQFTYLLFIKDLDEAEKALNSEMRESGRMRGQGEKSLMDDSLDI